MSNFPKSVAAMAGSGYKLKETGLCPGCENIIDWYETPRGKTIPMDTETAVPHWETCTNPPEKMVKRNPNLRPHPGRPRNDERTQA